MKIESDVEFTPDDMAVAHRIAHRLQGTADDFEMVTGEELEIEPSRGASAYFDRLLWRCKVCDYWTPTIELTDDEECMGCKPVRIE